jgi:short-subunit dehydrogenase
MNEKNTLLVLGGVSDMGYAIATVYAQNGWRIILAARENEDVSRNVGDLSLRYRAEVTSAVFDACKTADQPAFLDSLGALPDTAVCVVGYMGDQAKAESDTAHAAVVLRTNFEGPALLLGEIANRMAKRGSGTIVGVSSVAGDRGRGSNYVYGSAKAGLTAFLSGLRNRMTRFGVHVVTVKPGFVRTSMTAGLKLPKLLTAEPIEVGRAVYRAAEVKRHDVIYVLPMWRLIMLIIRTIPEAVFKKMRL